MIRTPREWDERCAACDGRGVVHKREHFELLTPEEYEARMGDPPCPLDAKYAAASDAYVCIAIGGSSIFEACKEGVEIAQRVQRTVVFEFNYALAVCRTDSDPTAVAKEWWVKAYGKTYEQSMRDR